MIAPVAALALALCLPSPSSPAPTPEPPPHIVVILVDDLGGADVSLPAVEGAEELRGPAPTPHIARLAREGMRATDAYAAGPVCTPTRASLLTGQAPARHGITYWTLHAGRDTSARHPTLSPPVWRTDGLTAEEVVLPALLKKAGYTTIHAGKAHYGAHGTSGADPRALGYDINIAGHASGAPGSFRGLESFTRSGRQGKLGGEPSVWDVPGLEKYHGQDIYLTEALAIEAVAAFEVAVRRGERVLLDFHPYAVHTPIQANRDKLAKYEGLDPREAAYATMIESVDDAVGSILDAIDRLGIAETTIVIFTSDNGGLSAHARGGTPHTHNAPWRSGKGSAYEGGTRVPGIIRWPGVTRPGAVTSYPWSTFDLFPTLLNAAGVRAPEGHTIDGVDLGPVLAGRERPARPLVWHQPHQWGAKGPGIEPFTSIRLGSEKLLHFHAGPRFELYDLAEDPGELRDLASARPERVLALAERLEVWLREAGALTSIDKASGEPIPGPLVSARALHSPAERDGE